MKIHILAIGRCTNTPEAEIVKRYIERTPWDITIKELEERRPIKGEERKKSEAGMLLAAIPKKSFIIILDERGKSQTSNELAKTITNAKDNGFENVCFIIGGADGLSADILAKAQLKISFGKMVWPHMMVRAMLTEQIYRSWAIINRHPYHKE